MRPQALANRVGVMAGGRIVAARAAGRTRACRRRRWRRSAGRPRRGPGRCGPPSPTATRDLELARVTTVKSRADGDPADAGRQVPGADRRGRATAAAEDGSARSIRRRPSAAAPRGPRPGPTATPPGWAPARGLVELRLFFRQRAVGAVHLRAADHLARVCSARSSPARSGTRASASSSTSSPGSSPAA